MSRLGKPKEEITPEEFMREVAHNMSAFGTPTRPEQYRDQGAKVDVVHLIAKAAFAAITTEKILVPGAWGPGESTITYIDAEIFLKELING